MAVTQKQKRYWRRNLRMTGILLLIWFLVTFAVCYYARELSRITVFGFPLGFYMGAQGALLIYLLIVGFYALYMNRLDRRYDLSERAD